MIWIDIDGYYATIIAEKKLTLLGKIDKYAMGFDKKTRRQRANIRNRDPDLNVVHVLLHRKGQQSNYLDDQPSAGSHGSSTLPASRASLPGWDAETKWTGYGG